MPTRECDGILPPRKYARAKEQDPGSTFQSRLAPLSKAFHAGSSAQTHQPSTVRASLGAIQARSGPARQRQGRFPAVPPQEFQQLAVLVFVPAEPGCLALGPALVSLHGGHTGPIEQEGEESRFQDVTLLLKRADLKESERAVYLLPKSFQMELVT